MHINVQKGIPVKGKLDISEAVQYAYSNGLVYSSQNVTETNYVPHVPFTLYPTPFHRPSFNIAIRATPLMNRVLSSIASDHQLLRKLLKDATKIDELTSGLINLLDIAPLDKWTVDLSITRNDYLQQVKHGEISPRLVEVNSIGPTMAVYGTKVSQLHKFVSDCSLDAHPRKVSSDRLLNVDIVDGLCQGLAVVHHHFLRNITKCNQIKSVILMVVRPSSIFVSEEEPLRHKLAEDHSLLTIRVTLIDVFHHAYVGEDDLLYIKLPRAEFKYLVSVVYYRAGFTEFDYPTDREWSARALVEKSRAVKCPTVGMQLAGTNAIQKMICDPNVLSQYLDSDEDVCELL